MDLKEDLNSTELENRLCSGLRELIPGAHLEWRELAHLSGLRALLIEELSGSRPLPADRVAGVMEAPPFWSLLWPAGHKLCELVTTNPQALRGRRVLDFGSGCGLVATAAAGTGATVTALDSDPLSRVSSRLNAQANGVSLEVGEWWAGEPYETVLLADLLYDESNLALLEQLAERTQEVLVVDSRLGELSLPGFEFLGSSRGLAVPDLDPSREFGVLNCWCNGPRASFWKSCFETVAVPINFPS